MTDRRARLRDERDRALFALRREERRLVREEAQMEAELDEFAQHAADVRAEIEEEWRREHWGHDPERRL